MLNLCCLKYHLRRVVTRASDMSCEQVDLVHMGNRQNPEEEPPKVSCRTVRHDVSKVWHTLTHDTHVYTKFKYIVLSMICRYAVLPAILYAYTEDYIYI